MTARSTAASVALLICGVTGAAVLGQETPTFRSRADAVSLSVFVTDRDGRPVHGLTADDFELFERGKPREITTFEEIDVPLPDRRETLTGDESDVRTNDGAPGRVYLFALAVDDPCMALKTRFLIKQFLQQYFGPNDIAAVTVLGPGRRTDGQEFTNSVRLIVQAVDKFSGGFGECLDDGRFEGASSSRLPGSETGGIGRDMRDLVEVLAKMEGRHQTLLYFSERAAFDWRGVIDYQTGLGSWGVDDARAAMSATTRANLTIYPIDPRGLMISTGGLERRMLLRDMGLATGGFATTGTNTFTDSFDRIAIDSSSFYALAFNSGHEKDDGRFVSVAVKVKRPGLTVRTREGYIPLTRQQRAALQRRMGPPSTGVLGALASPVATHTGVPLRVHAVPFRRSSKLAEVVLTVETDASSLSFSEKDGTFAGQVDLRHLANDARKRIFPEIRGSGSITLQRAAYDRAMEHGLRFVSVFEFPAGRYQLRIASGSGSRTGSVVYDLEIPDFSDESITLSGIELTTARAALAPTALAVTRDLQKPANCRNNSCQAPRLVNTTWGPYAIGGSSKTQPTFAAALPGPPTTVRRFTALDRLTLYAETYDNREAGARDHQRPLVATTSIYDARDTVVRRTTDDALAQPADASAGTYAIQTTIPLTGFKPGAYVLEIAVAPYGQADPSVIRRVPFQVE